MAAGDVMLDSSGNVMLDSSGNVKLDDGSGCAACCEVDCDGPGCSVCAGHSPTSYLVVVSGYTAPTAGTCYVNLSAFIHNSIKWLDSGTGAQVNGTRCFVATGTDCQYDGGSATVSHVDESHSEGFPPDATWSTCSVATFVAYGDNYSRFLTVVDNGDGTFAIELNILAAGGCVFSGAIQYTPTDPTRPCYESVTVTNGTGSLPLIQDSFGCGGGGSATITPCCPP